MTERNRSREAVKQADPAAELRTNLGKIAAAWGDLNARLANSGGGNNEPVSGTTNPSLVINMHVSDVITNVTNDTWFAVRVLLEETNSKPPDPARSIPVTLMWLAQWRATWLARHVDLGDAFVSDWANNQRRVAKAAYSEPVRTIAIHVPCPEHGTDEFGQRVPCAGALTVKLDPAKQGLVPDLICDRDVLHRISPVEWQRAARKSGYDQKRIVEILSERAG